MSNSFWAIGAVNFAVFLLLTACQSPSTIVCASGRVCPSGTICDGLLDECVLPGQRNACNGLSDSDSCSVAGFGGAPGICRDSLCILAGCGDGFVLGAEACDGENLGESSDCLELGYIESAPLGCNDDCTYDQSACAGYCGDGIVSGPESCDGRELDGKDCTDLGFYNPDGLICNPIACVFDSSACTGFCGDGMASNGESCDGADLLGQDCIAAGFYNAGGLACNTLCGLDTSACTGFCGDNSASNGESCDGTDLGGLDCTDRGFYNPDGLACNGFCGFDTGACSGFCGDDAVTNGEACDGTNLGGIDCTDLGFYYGAGLSCNPTACVYDATSCSGTCGDGVTDFLFFEACDEGGGNSIAPDAQCRPNCLPQRCGDGILDVLAGEDCDDGNPLPGDGCSGQCLNEVCGNGVVDLEVSGNGFLPSEECDDGANGLNHDGCAGACLAEDQRWRLKLADNVPGARNRHAMVYDLARERVLLFGGSLGLSQGQFGDTWEWDGTSWTERIVTSAPSPRFGTAMAYDAARGTVVLFGGGFRGNSNNETWEWNGVTWTRMTPATSPPIRYRHAMAYDAGRGRVVLFGGAGGNNAGAFNDTWEWDGNDWTEVTPASSPPSRRNHAMTYDPVNGEVVLFGGGGDSVSGTLADTWTWDGSSWTERTPATSPPARDGLALAYNAARGRVVLFGGGFARGTGGLPLADTWEWDGASWTETTTAASPTIRYRHAMAYDTVRDKMVVFGGSGGAGTGAKSDTWEGSGGPTGTDWTLIGAPATPGGRENPALGYDRSRGRVVLFGGKDGAGVPLADTWEWDGARWVEIATTGGPSARERSAMAYDPTRGKLILFGGGLSRGGGTFGDTWEWDGSDWTELTPANAPSARYHHAMAHDAARGRIVLFGGSTGGGLSGPLADTWTWDGSDWTEVSPVTSPSGRTSFAMDYDARRQRVVLFGGSRLHSPLSDTWEWDGSAWTEQTPPVSPPQRYRYGMAYDAVTSQIVIFGGSGGNGVGSRNDTWTWDGSNWTNINPPNGPVGRRRLRMVYDALRAELLLFGGASRLSNPVFDDTHALQFFGGVRESCTTGLDVDGDGLIGCADPDCWSRCTPECPPNSTPAWPGDCSTAGGVPRCGDGVCNLNLENSRMCPTDCAPTPMCGDFFCEGAESIANCPGDCTP